MSSPVKTKAIVVNARKYGESDLIVSFVTEGYGLVSGLAKGALKSRKRFAGCFEPFTMVELSCVLKADALARIEAADIIDAHYGIREDLDRIGAASSLVELASLVRPPLQETAIAFRLIDSGLSGIEGSDTPLELLAVYMLKYLAISGFGIHPESCSECGTRIEGGAAYRGGEGVVCPRCSGASGIAISAGLLAFMKSALSVDSARAARLRMPAAAMRDFCRFMAMYIRSVSDREPMAFLLATGASLA